MVPKGRAEQMLELSKKPLKTAPGNVAEPSLHLGLKGWLSSVSGLEWRSDED